MKNGAAKTTFIIRRDYTPDAVTPIRVAFLSSEVAPFAKTGGLADVSRSLPRVLAKLGHEVRVFLPLYRLIDRDRYGIRPLGPGSIALDVGGEKVRFALQATELPGTDVPVVLIDCPLFYERDGIYTNDPDEPHRFLFFSRAVFESCQRLGFQPDILHANDWQTALVPLLRKTAYSWDRLFQASRTVLTIHNLAYQGVFGARAIAATGVGDRAMFDASDLREGRINLLKTGLLHADRLTTVSPTYALEIQGPAQGYGLDPLLRSRAAALDGILNGVDYDEWDPSRDTYIPHRYSVKSLSRKKKNKEALLLRLQLPYSESVPLVGMVSRLSHQKGIEILYESLPEILAREEIAFVVLGTGEQRYENFFTALEKGFPGRVRFINGFSEELAHWIEAGSDFFLMPSRYEPCGLNQMYSLRYGTVPIVRKTGGLADSVRLFDPESGDGTGIVFEHFDASAVSWALTAAIRLFHDEKSFRRLVRNGMAEDFSWERQAERYVALYRQLLIN
jgi:starch synthase